MFDPRNREEGEIKKATPPATFKAGRRRSYIGHAARVHRLPLTALQFSLQCARARTQRRPFNLLRMATFIATRSTPGRLMRHERSAHPFHRESMHVSARLHVCLAICSGRTPVHACRTGCMNHDCTLSFLLLMHKKVLFYALQRSHSECPVDRSVKNYKEFLSCIDI